MSQPDSVPWIRFRFPETITWAGEFPGAPGSQLCFGTEDGHLRFGTPQRLLPGRHRLSTAEEAVNGVAATHSLMAVSSRDEVIFREFDSFKASGEEYPYEGGAHGVISTPRERILAPIGSAGVLVAEFKNRRFTFKQLQGPDLYFYRLVSLGRTEEMDDLVAGACRHGGIIAFTVRPSGEAAVHASFRSSALDIIDVCSMADRDRPRAVAGLGYDCSIHLSPDLITKQEPTTLRFSQFGGTGHAIRSARGHVFVLTSEGLYLIPDLATRFLDGQRIGGPSKTRLLSVDAFDFSIAYDRWLIALEPNLVTLLDLDALVIGADLDSGLIQTPAFDGQIWEAVPSFGLEAVPA
jgi:hypothetical protein